MKNRGLLSKENNTKSTKSDLRKLKWTVGSDFIHYLHKKMKQFVDLVLIWINFTTLVWIKYLMIIFHTGYASNRTTNLNILILCLVLTTQQWAIFLPFSLKKEKHIQKPFSTQIRNLCGGLKVIPQCCILYPVLLIKII